MPAPFSWGPKFFGPSNRRLFWGNCNVRQCRHVVACSSQFFSQTNRRQGWRFELWTKWTLGVWRGGVARRKREAGWSPNYGGTSKSGGQAEMPWCEWRKAFEVVMRAMRVFLENTTCKCHWRDPWHGRGCVWVDAAGHAKIQKLAKLRVMHLVCLCCSYVCWCCKGRVCWVGYTFQTKFHRSFCNVTRLFRYNGLVNVVFLQAMQALAVEGWLKTFLLSGVTKRYVINKPNAGHVLPQTLCLRGEGVN